MNSGASCSRHGSCSHCDAPTMYTTFISDYLYNLNRVGVCVCGGGGENDFTAYGRRHLQASGDGQQRRGSVAEELHEPQRVARAWTRYHTPSFDAIRDCHSYWLHVCCRARRKDGRRSESTALVCPHPSPSCAALRAAGTRAAARGPRRPRGGRVGSAGMPCAGHATR